MSQTAIELLYDFEIACFAVAHDQSGPVEKEVWQSTKAALTAALANTQGGVKVKELEFDDTHAERGYWRAATQFGYYRIKRYDEKQFILRGPLSNDLIYPSFEAAKAAAQQDYQTRILSAITLQGEPVGCEDEGCPHHGTIHECNNPSEDYLVDQTIELLRLSDKGELATPLGVTAYALLRGLAFNRIKDQAKIAELENSKYTTVEPVGYVTETDINDARTLGVGRLFGVSRDKGIPVYTSPPSSEMYLALNRIQDAGLKGFLSPELCADIVNTTLAHQPVTASWEKVTWEMVAAFREAFHTPPTGKGMVDFTYDEHVMRGLTAALKSEGLK